MARRPIQPGSVKPNVFRRMFRGFVNFKWGYLLFAVMFCLAGFVFILYPAQATKGACITVGIAAFLFSAFALAMTLARRDRGFRYWAMMVTTGLGVVTSIIIIILACVGRGEGVFHALVLILAVYMIIDGSFKLQTAILSRRYKSWLWWVLFVLVIIGIGLGVIALYNGSNMGELIEREMQAEDSRYWISRLVGFSFFIDGVMNLLSIFFLYRIERGQKYEVIRELEEEGRIAVVEDASPERADTTQATQTPAAVEPPEDAPLLSGEHDMILLTGEDESSTEVSSTRQEE